MTVTPRVSVVVPVYGGAAETGRCLASVLDHAPALTVPFDLVVVDDASPDPAVRAELERVAAEPAPVAVTLLRNPDNVGFVASVNRGIRHADGDVVVLNADTVVTAGWLDALADAARGEDVATVTPLTSSGSFCTLPPPVVAAFGLDGPEPRIDACADFVREQSLGLRPEVITGVGFCLYVTREAIDRCGPLDERDFGKGYGEEVDFCLRATRLGFRHLVEDATYVHHWGGVSFGAERVAGLARGSAVLRERYPFFRATNARERAEHPLAVAFKALELALTERNPARPHVLQVLHQPSPAAGGTEKHVQALDEALGDRFDVSVLHPVESGFVLRTRWMVGGPEPIAHELLFPGGGARARGIHDPVAAAALQTVLDLFDVDAVHLHNLIGHSLAPLSVLADFPGPVVCTVHDLYLACPNHSLLYLDTEPCGIPEDLEVCARCLPASRVGEPVSYLRRFRAEVEAHLDVVDHFVVASQSAADHLLRAYDVDEARIELIEHGAIIEVPDERVVDERHVLEDPLRLAFVGRGWRKKGLDVASGLADAGVASGVEVHHFGPLEEPASPSLVRHGAYDNRELPRLLRDAGIHVVLLPGPYAETFGYVMTEALAAGLPVIGAGYGALGQRIRALGVGWTFDPQEEDELPSLVEHLDRCRPEVLRATRRAAATELRSTAATADRYAELYQGAHLPTDRRRPTVTDNADAEADRLRRHARALAAVNHQLHAQLDATARTRGRDLTRRWYDELERRAPRTQRSLELVLEAAASGRLLVDMASAAVRRRRG